MYYANRMIILSLADHIFNHFSKKKKLFHYNNMMYTIFYNHISKMIRF